MYLGHYKLKQDPFSAPPDTHIFFPGGGREKVLQHVLEDLASGMNLIHLSGEEGSGKTLLCQLIREKIRLPQTVVLLSEPSGTFDDKGRSLALALGEKDVKHLAGVKLFEKILRLISDRADNGGSTLFIIDDAEKLIPTVLNRILRLAYDAQPRGGVQFVLAGRLALAANPEQFITIRAEPLKQFTYTLQPLDRDDTARYLAFRLAVAGIPDDKQAGVFSAEAVTRIHEATCGNIRLINILAEEALRNSCKGKSFKVLLEHVKAPSNLSPIGISRPSQPHRTLRKKLAGLIALIIMAAILAYDMVLVDIKPKQHIDEPQAMTQEAPSYPAEKLPTPPPAATVTPPPPVVASPLAPAATSPPIPEPSMDVTTQPTSQEALSSPAEKLPTPPPTPTVTPPPPVVASPQAPAATPKPIPKPSMDVTTQPASQEATPVYITVKERKRKHLSGSKIFDERKRATRTWISGGLRGRYTIQIFMAKAPEAEKQTRHIFDDEVYQKIQDHIYIQQKDFSTPTIFVYHGIYNSMQEARLARDQLPASMKKYNPFPLAIADTIKKSDK